ncbi:unnamed protein product, partial [Mesorhabditis spiculigera]
MDFVAINFRLMAPRKMEDVATTPVGMDMTMDMTGSTMKMPMKMHKMWMWFHTHVEDTILFDFWTVNTAGEMVYSCFILLFLAIGLEALKWARWRAEQHWDGKLPETYIGRLFHHAHLVQVLLFFIQITLGYLLMLAFMTFSIWVGLAIAIGSGIGFYFFGSRPVLPNRSRPGEECCG